MDIKQIATALSKSPAVLEKSQIRSAYQPAEKVSGSIFLGDDAAAIPYHDQWLLFAGEAMLPSFIRKDPWFAGYSAVMVNISDIASMGGRAIAIIDLLWKSNESQAGALWEGMQEASKKYQVPIVGGHTSSLEHETLLGASIIGEAKKLLTSFDAKAGDELLLAVDMRASYRGDDPFWNASVEADSERLRGDLELLPLLAEAGLCHAAKDISNAGIFGTLMMFLECSQIGASVCLDKLFRPNDGDFIRWLTAFPSFGFLLAIEASKVSDVVSLFHQRDIACASVGMFHTIKELNLIQGNEQLTLWRDGQLVS
ncbi:MAG: sll0787 family AIR synthase-like protein [Verrucomicrobiota bacterium]